MAKDVDGDEAVSVSLLENARKGREQLDKIIAQRTSISMLLTIFLIAQALAFDIPVSVVGITIKPAPRIFELLIAISALLMAWTYPLIANRYLLSSLIKHTIQNIYPDSVGYLHERSLLPDEPPYLYNPSYQPTVVASKGKQIYTSFTVAYLLFLIVVTSVATLIGRVIIYKFAFMNPSFEYSHYFLALCIFVEVSATMYLLYFILPLPHRDYALIERFQVLDQINPEQAERERSEAFRVQREDRQRLIDLGYMTNDE